MNLATFFDYSSATDSTGLAADALQALRAGTLSLDAVEPALVMAAAQFLSDRRASAQSAHFAARQERVAAERSGDKQRVAVAVFDEVAKRRAFLDERIFLGDGYVLVGDATVADFDKAIAWVEQHELGPATRKISQYKTYQDDIRKAGVRTLRALP